MLLQLRIHNIALIDDLTVNFTEGMNCLTGETGAGKSIVIDSIECVLGGRTSKEIIRTGCDNAFVDGLFYCESPEISAFFDEVGIPQEPDNSIVIHRDMNISGRNVCRINGCMTTASMLRRLGSLLLDIHGQTDNQSLLNIERHIQLLDLFCGSEMTGLKEVYCEKRKELSDLERKLDSLSGSPEERAKLIDLYSYQIDEIEKSGIYDGEDDELAQRRTILLNYEKIANKLNEAYEVISGGDYSSQSVRDMLDKCVDCFAQISNYSEKYAQLYDKIQEIAYLLDDISTEIRRENDDTVYDREELENINDRIDFLNDLKRKYNKSLGDILLLKDNLQNQIDELKASDFIVEETMLRIKSVCTELYDICEDMNFARVKAAAVIEKAIATELTDVELRNAQFKVDIVFDDSLNSIGRYNFTSNGLDKVQFLVSTNAGEPVKPLAKVASGGEMSRIMLAIKTILADYDKIPTLIFDEIDTGISGFVTSRVAQKLKMISNKHQVLCVTHHAPIAAISDNNILIKKQTLDGKTITYIETLDSDNKIKEIARLLDGDAGSEISLLHAQNLINKMKI